MLKPKRLSPGARVQIVMPASPVRPEFFEPGVQALRSMGFQVQFGNDVYRKWRYLAGSDEVRRSELLDALQDPEVDAIFFARGGYGSSRLLKNVPEYRGPGAKNPSGLFGYYKFASLFSANAQLVCFSWSDARG